VVSIRIRYITGVAIGRRIFLQIARKEEPTSGLEPLTCSLRVIHQALQGCIQACNSPIPKRLSLLWVAACCTVLRSRWYQSGIKSDRKWAIPRSYERVVPSRGYISQSSVLRGSEALL
jgi:hypothetical protein